MAWRLDVDMWFLQFKIRKFEVDKQVIRKSWRKREEMLMDEEGKVDVVISHLDFNLK